MPRGRPSKYKPEYCHQIIDFFCYPLRYIDKEGNSKIADPKFMTDFAQSIGVSRDTLSEWQSKHKDFSVAFKKAKDLMINAVVKGGLTNAYNSGVVCFTLKNVAGWRDKSEVEHSGDKGVNIVVIRDNKPSNGETVVQPKTDKSIRHAGRS